MWSEAALTLFRERAIDPDVASAAGVREDSDAGQIVYPTGKRRPLNGNGVPHLSPGGEPVKPWPVGAKPAETVLVTEGETDGLAARSALTNGSPFADTPILALPGCTYPPNNLAHGLAHYHTRDAYLALDPDEAGQRARIKITAALEARGIRAIPVELPDGFDLAAWLADGGDLPHALADAEAAYTRQRQGVSFAEVEPEPVEWLWRQRIPRGYLSVLAGDPGQGKSLYTVALAAELSRAGKTVLMANEDDGPGEVRVRLSIAGADLKHVRPLERFEMPGDIARLRERIRETGADLLTLDPWDSYVGDVNPQRRHEVYRALTPLRDLAKELGVAIVIVCHALRPNADEPPIFRIPVGLRDIARSVLTVKRDERATVLAHPKSTYGDEQPPITYRFEAGQLVEVVAGRDLSSKTNAVAETSPGVERIGSIETRDYSQMGVMGVDEFDN